jgi:transposase
MAPPRRVDFEQVFALPPRLEDWLPADHPARFVRDFVDSLDLPALGFVDKNVVGKEAPYAVDLLLRVWLYGLLERFRSTRRLEWACLNVLALRWLTGNQPPDHTTLWRFFRDHKPALRALFRQSVRVAADLGLVGMVLHAIDGTRLQAACSTSTADHRANLQDALKRLDRAVEWALDHVQNDPAPTDSGLRLPPSLAELTARRDAIHAALARLHAANTPSQHPKEPEARLQRSRGRLVLGYNAQAAADASHAVVLACEVVPDENDAAQLAPMVDAIEANVDAHAEQTVADAGYAVAEQLDAVQEQGRATVVVAGLEEAARKNPFDKSNFRYDEERDGYVCPRGTFLALQSVVDKSRERHLAQYHCKERQCPERASCTQSKEGRTVLRGPYDEAVERQRKEQQTEDAQTALRWRKAVIELVFARAKWLEGFVRFTARGLESVRTQWALLCTTLNLRAIYGVWRAGTRLPAQVAA